MGTEILANCGDVAVEYYDNSVPDVEQQAVWIDESGMVIANKALFPPSPWTVSESSKYQGQFLTSDSC